MRKITILSILFLSHVSFGAGEESATNRFILLPLSLSLTNPFVYTNAYWWTNDPPQTNISTWQAWWAINENWRRTTNWIGTQHVRLVTPEWRDQIISGMALGAGASAPGVVAVSAGFIRGLGFAHGEDGHAACQFNHDVAPTNASLPAFYVEPHVHLSAVSLAGGTNATFAFRWEWAAINGRYTNSSGSLTNSVSFTNLYDHVMMEFGHVTNDAMQGAISSILRFGIERLNGGAGDMGNTRAVVVDSVDVHYPVWRLGSAEPSTD